jgi:amidohydrolase
MHRSVMRATGTSKFTLHVNILCRVYHIIINENSGIKMSTLETKNPLGEAVLAGLRCTRQLLHQNPELSGDEKNTAAFVVRYLSERSAPDGLHTGLGGHGVAAVFDSGRPGKTVLFRAELDALPIAETNSFGYVSSVAGVSHKCGHDGHMTTLLGLAIYLHTNKPTRGKVVLLFQPAEETGRGAEAILEDPKFLDNVKPDLVFAFHNIPGHPVGHIILRNGAFTASVRSMVIKLNGKTSHAAEPENGISPALCIAQLIVGLDALSNNDVNRPDFRVITLVHITMGEVAYGVSAGHGEVHMTIRTWTESEMTRLEQEIKDLTLLHCVESKLTHDISYTDIFRANESTDSAVETVRNAAVRNHFVVENLEYPKKWGEDFGLFTQKYSGCFFGIGSGVDRPALHNPDYDYPDDILAVGLNTFTGILVDLDMYA